MTTQKKKLVILFCLLLFMGGQVNAQMENASLQECIKVAMQNNKQIQQMDQSYHAREYTLKATKLSRIPKVNLVAGYTFLSNPLTINLQDARNSVVEGTAQQNVDAIGKAYKNITGNTMPSGLKNAIYSGSKDIIDKVYPDYNPQLSKRQYFTAGIEAHVPIFMGGKIHSAKRVAKSQLEASRLNKDLLKNTVVYGISTQYLRVQYLNSMVKTQKNLLEIYQATKKDAEALVKSEIIPPYQANWANIALFQAKTTLKNLQLEKENGVLLLKDLMGKDTLITITDTLATAVFLPNVYQANWEENTTQQWLKGKVDVAQSIVSTNKSSYWPNIFAVGNYQFFRKNLPVITPPWQVGVVLQWNIFSGFQTKNRVKASKALLKESQLVLQEHKDHLSLKERILRNKISSFRHQMETLREAKKQAATTTEMVRKRLDAKLASVKEVNDVLKMQLQAEKAYYTAVLNYNLAVVTYLKTIGKTDLITHYIQ